jgi:hypothetical protein
MKLTIRLIKDAKQGDYKNAITKEAIVSLNKLKDEELDRGI